MDLLFIVHTNASQFAFFNVIYKKAVTMAGFDLTAHSFNHLGGRRR
jgi:hypothetical protein